MFFDPIAGSAAAQTASDAAAQKAGGDFNTFLKLLAAQLQNQDPLNPADGTEFTAQLATFSQLEQQINSNRNLEELVKQNNFGAQNLAVSYIGKEALMPGGSVAISDPVTGETEATFAYKVDEAMREATVEIVSATGQVVSSVSGATTPGIHIIEWDGFNSNGSAVPNGDYTLRVKGSTTLEKKDVTLQGFTYGIVTEVESFGGTVSLHTQDGRTVNFEDVLSVRA